MKAIIAAVFIVSSIAGFAQTAPTAAPPTDTTVALANAKPPKPICRRESVTGSNFQTRTCHSKEEWAAIDSENAANAERMSNSRRTTN
ncbi:hypothetical protein [Sphingomonas sp. R86520]|uniref:hypothetical protein n=1 Tax=Sphingomonas sp. R86520 TaxID=3093859 RepID=UPI0036D433CE